MLPNARDKTFFHKIRKSFFSQWMLWLLSKNNILNGANMLPVNPHSIKPQILVRILHSSLMLLRLVPR